MHVYLQLSAHVQRVSRSARGIIIACCPCCARVGDGLPSSVAVAVQDCLAHLFRHRWNTSERSPDEAQAVVIQIIAITSGRRIDYFDFLMIFGYYFSSLSFFFFWVLSLLLLL